mmetsp:Transcript_11329/g.28587  ORF Transcript_11329/g.28587 Transcript_11329/m.28587 type:complete len:325 (+) Transcript_11329:47-1021(+)
MSFQASATILNGNSKPLRPSVAVAAVVGAASERCRAPLSRRLLAGGARRLQGAAPAHPAAGWGALGVFAPGACSDDTDSARPSVATAATNHGHEDSHGRHYKGAYAATTMVALPRVNPDALADEVVEDMQAAGIRCVAFDMDQTMVDRHSRGRLRKSKLDWFASHTTPAFLTLVPKLLEAGIHVAMATASDKAEYRPHAPKVVRTTPETHLLGEDLVTPLLQKVLPEHADRFFMVCYNPRVHGAEGAKLENNGKEVHIRNICNHFDIPAASVILLDDEERNHIAHVRNQSQFTSIKVDGKYGLQLPKLAKQVKKLAPHVKVIEL